MKIAEDEGYDLICSSADVSSKKGRRFRWAQISIVKITFHGR